MIKRSIAIDGHRTSIALEAEYWRVVEAMATARGESLARFVARLDAERVAEGPVRGLASYLRLAALAAALQGEPALQGLAVDPQPSAPD